MSESFIAEFHVANGGRISIDLRTVLIVEEVDPRKHPSKARCLVDTDAREDPILLVDQYELVRAEWVKAASRWADMVNDTSAITTEEDETQNGHSDLRPVGEA